MIRKQPDKPEDYLTAHSLVNQMKIGHSDTIEVSNIKAFRKYICDLGSKQGRKYTTRTKNGSLFIMRIL